MNALLLDKYKPSNYSEFNINPQTITLLRTLIMCTDINIILVGPHGSGKSSLLDATILEYYNMDAVPSDSVLYINPLYLQGISYYRTQVKNFCKIKCNIPNKKKIIVIDDLDNISPQSQQVFRSYIDRYSHNVNFIASCCNLHKVVENIQSRNILIKLTPFTEESLYNIHNKIVTREQIQITPDATKYLVGICNHSIRVLINYLEKFILINELITLTIAVRVCTNISFFEFQRYTHEWYIDRNIKGAINTINHIFENGYSVMDILDSYFIFIKATDMLDESTKYKCIKIMCGYIHRFHIQHEHEVELVFLTSDFILSL
jgi:DNA polymerase III delta prime subunit